jgi:hypothetical protein
MILALMLLYNNPISKAGVCSPSNYSGKTPNDVTQVSKNISKYCSFEADSRLNNDQSNNCHEVDIFLGGEDPDAKYCYLNNFKRKDTYENGWPCHTYYIDKQDRPKLETPQKFSYYIGVCYDMHDSGNGENQNLLTKTLLPMGKAWVYAFGQAEKTFDQLNENDPGSIEDYHDDSNEVDISGSSYFGSWGAMETIKVVNEGYYGPAEIKICSQARYQPNIGCKSF